MLSIKSNLATIGYEGATLSDFIATLQAEKITRLIDVREIAISRRKGFAKTALSTALAKAGIEYVHLRGLGDPKPGRDAARNNEIAKFRRIFSQHMKTDVAQADLRIATELAVSGSTCLMCFEKDHTNCHRALVADAVSATIPITIKHLGVRGGDAAKHRPKKRSRKSSYPRQSASTRRQTSR